MNDVEIELALLRREVALERQLQQLSRDNAIYYYRPHEKQFQFHISDYRFRHARYGNQTGKSEMGSVEDISYALGYRPFMEQRFPVINGKGDVVSMHEGYKGHPYSTVGIPPHATKGLIIVEDWDKSKEVFTEMTGSNKGKLFTYIPADKIGTPSRNHSGGIDRIPVKHKSGDWSVIHIDTVKSFKQNQMSVESSIWDWIHVDEPCPQKMFTGAARGLMARNGRAWLNLTPLTEPWIQDMFSPETGQILDDVGAYINDDKIMLVATMYDNPYLTPEGRDAYIRLLTDDEKDCRVTGIPSAYSGIVYKEFEQAVHMPKEHPVGWADWFTPPDSHTLRFAIDYHPRKPHHVLFIATSPQDYQYIFNEVFYSCLMHELVAEIRGVLHFREPTVPGLIDPLAATPNRVTDVTPLEEVLRLGLPVLPATKDPHNGILKCKTLLKARDRSGRPILTVNPACRRFLREITRGYVWDKETNKPLKQEDDAMENFYRLVLQGLPYIEPATPSDFLTPNEDSIPEFDELVHHNFGTFFESETTNKRRGISSSRYRR